MDWDPIRPNSVADPALVEQHDDDAGSAAVFVEELAARYLDGPHMRIDATLAAFLSSITPSFERSRSRLLRRRVTGIAVPIAAVLSLGAANMLPAAAQSAFADAARVVGLSIPEPAPEHHSAPHDRSGPMPSVQSSGKPAAGEPHGGTSTTGSQERDAGKGAGGSASTPSGPGTKPEAGSPGNSDGNGPPESPGNSADHSQGNGPPANPGNPQGNGPPESPGSSADHSQGNGPPASPGNSPNNRENVS